MIVAYIELRLIAEKRGHRGLRIEIDGKHPISCLLYTSRCVSETDIKPRFSTLYRLAEVTGCRGLVRHLVEAKAHRADCARRAARGSLRYGWRRIGGCVPGYEIPKSIAPLHADSLPQACWTNFSISVAYTHLDVYKRQGFLGAGRGISL